MKHSSHIVNRLWVCIRQVVIATTLVFGLSGASCRQAQDTLHDAVITGYDQRMCPCCGGLMITFNGETRPNTGEFYLVENNPSEFKLSASESFPLRVKVAYTVLDKCNRTFVRLSRLVRL